ncbi:MAG: hypothetical protein LBI73_03070 [Myroides sp.]|jgi:hypothetical protein|nr:hypothetical protein [Myroides sp.]
MKNKIALSVVLLSSSLGFGQVGINTKLPLHPIHIDAKQNNPIDRVPSNDQSKDDFIVTKEGNVGVGVTSATSKLEVNGTIRLKDGKEAQNKILMSNDKGVARWEKVPYDIPTSLGEFESTTPVIWNGAGEKQNHLFVNYKVKLTKGRWVVSTGLVFKINNSSDWILTIISSSKLKKEQVGFRFVAKAGVNAGYAAHLRLGKGMLMGSSIVEVLDEEITLYVLVNKTGNWEFNPLSEQNFLYATPVL